MVRSFEVAAPRGAVVEFEHTFAGVREPFYLRLRGTDGNYSRPGSIEPRVDPIGNAEPWDDLWCYSNPVFVSAR